MKKTVTAIITASLVLSAFALPSYAKTDTSDTGYSTSMSQADEVKKLVADVKSKIYIPDSLTEFSSNKTVNGGMTMYEFSWNDTDGDSSCYVSVNSKGDIVNYSAYSNSDSYDTYSLFEQSDDAVKETAEKWLKSLNLSYFGELDFENAVINTDIYGKNISVEINRVSNGKIFHDNYVYLSIDKKTQAVNRFNSTWDYLPLPTSDGLISENEAKEKYKQAKALELVYVPDTDYYGINDKSGKKAVLKYKVSDIMINAKTAAVENNDNYRSVYNTAALEASKDEYSAGSGLTEKEISEIEKLSTLISEKDAEKAAVSIENTNLNGFSAKSYRYFNNDEKYTVRIFLENEDGDHANVTLDAVTGDLISLSSYRPVYDSGSDKRAFLTETEARSAADSFIEKYNPKKSEYKFDGYDSNCVKYVRTVNGIPYRNDSIRAVLNSDGSIAEYYSSYTDNISFENSEGILSEEQAYEKLFEHAGFVLGYKKFYTKTDRDSDGEIKLIYSKQGECYYIDARTGKPSGNFNYKIIYPADMAGHYAEKAVNTLVRNNVIVLEDENFRPDDTLNQKEALAMLGVLAGWYEPRAVITDEELDIIYGRTIRRGIISADEKNPSAPVTREKAVKYILNAVGYSNIKNIDENVFEPGFNDCENISDGYRGYVAAAKGLGIVKGDENGSFNPGRQVTKGQLAVMLYNALSAK